MRTLFVGIACLLLAAVCVGQSSPTISQVFAFTCNANFSECPYGIEPTLAPIQLADGYLYGVTWWAGQNNPNAGGTVWKISTSGKSMALHTFEPNKTGQFPRGENPVIGFAQGTDHNLYGISEQGGTTNQGVMYQLLPTGHFQVLHNFCTGSCTDIQGPVITGQDGNFYGVQTGGAAIFKITPAGVYSIVHMLNPTTEGRAEVLIQGKDGNFYGTGSIGSACQEAGTVFKMTAAGAFKVLHQFGDLELVRDTLVQATDGNFYGSVDSSIFRITSKGTVTTIYNLQGEDGYTVVQMRQASDGNLWILSSDGGPVPARPGEVFAITLHGTEVATAAFTCATTGCSPSGMIQGADHNFYGIAGQGGSAPGQNPYGTLFKIDAGIQ